MDSKVALTAHLEQKLKESAELVSIFIACGVDGSPEVDGRIHSTLQEARSLLQQLNEDRKTAVGDSIASQLPSGPIDFWYKFLENCFPALGTGLSASLGQSLVLILALLMDLTDCSKKLRTNLIRNGLLYQHFYQLEELKNAEHSKFAKTLAIANIGVLYNCCKEEGFHLCFKKLDPVLFWRPFLMSTDVATKIHSKFVFSQLKTMVSKSAYDSLLKFKSEEMGLLLNLLDAAVSSPELVASGFGCSFTACELVVMLQGILSCEENGPLLIERGGLGVLIKALVAGGVSEQKEACLLLWSLSRYQGFEEEISESEIPFDELLEELQLSANADLQMVTACVLSAMQLKEGGLSISILELYYQFQHYNECLERINRILTQSNSKEVIKNVELLKGKCLFHLYREKRAILKKESLPVKEYKIQISQCDSMNKNVILLLGRAVDDYSIDSDGSKILDLAMVDYVHNTNSLNECKRCLLCRSKAELRKSHMCPHAILRAYTSGSILPKSHRIFDTSSSQVGQCKSPKEATYFMFCHSCEQKFCDFGEKQFLPLFFKKVYDNGPQKSHSIVYKEWLYQFCLGMVFRGLAQQDICNFYNSGDLYESFIALRSSILDSAVAFSFPVALILNPTISPEAMECGFINHVLNMPYFVAVKSYNTVPSVAHFVVVHTGVFNIIMTLTSPKSHVVDERYIIDSREGTYPVPTEEDRTVVIPKGLWKLFQSMAIEFETRWLERPAKPAEKILQQEVVHPPEELKQTFNIVKSVETDLVRFADRIQSSTVADHCKVISLLPCGFSVSSTQQPDVVVVPNGHRVLLHLPKSKNEMIILATGTAPSPFHIEKPYILYHYREPGLKLTAGFFISPTDLRACEYLPYREELYNVNKIAAVQEFRDNVHATLSKLLKRKGIHSLSHIIRRLKNLESEATFDLKCLEPNTCWYCKNLCTVCLKPVPYGCYSHVEEDTVWKFCSENCQAFYSSPSSLCVSYVRPQQSKSLLKLTGVTKYNHTQYAIEIELCLDSCCSNELYLLCYHVHSIHFQAFLDFFVSDDGMPEKLIPPINSESEENFLQLKEQGSIQSLILFALNELGCQKISSLAVHGHPCSNVTLSCRSVSLLLPTVDLNVSNLEKIAETKLNPDAVSKFCSDSMLMENLKLLSLAPIQLVSTMTLNPSIQSVEFENCSISFAINSLCLVEYIASLLLHAINDEMANLDVTSTSHEAGNKLYNLLSRLCQVKGQNVVGDQLATFPNLVSKLLESMKQLYSCLCRGFPGNLDKCLLQVITVLTEFSKSSMKLKRVLIANDTVSYLVQQLIILQDVVELDDFIEALIVATLGLLQSCAQNVDCLWQFEDSGFIRVTYSFCKSPLSKIRHSTLSALSFLYLRNDDLKLLQLEKKESDELVKALKTASLTSDDIIVHDFKYLLLEFFTFVKNLLLCRENVKLLLGSNFGECIAILLEKDLQRPESEKVLEIVWQILQDHEYKKALVPQIETVAISKNVDSVLYDCVLWILHDEESQIVNEHNLSTIFPYIKGCYKYGFYCECIKWCDRCLTLCDKVEVKILKGKSLFHIFRKDQLCLRSARICEKDYRFLHAQCYEKAKDVILLLGLALDSGCLDPEGSKFLDIAMIDFLHETNRLNDCSRCLLCREKKVLLRSHLWPRALLDHATSKSVSKKLMLSWDKNGRWFGPKEVTFFMFCKTCEEILNKHGEYLFVAKFFQKICDLTTKEIEYDKWLYQFCVGVIFRCLAQRHMEKFLNGDELYEVFLKCRQLLLSFKFDAAHPMDTDSINVFLLLSPLKLKTEEKFLNQVLQMAGLFAVEEFRLGDGVISIPREAHFVLCHFGTLNFLLKLKPSKEVQLPSSALISISNGVFEIPSEEERRALVPNGLWMFFRHLAQDIETKWLQIPAKQLELLSKFDEELYSSFTSSNTAVQIKPHSVTGSFKVINTMPQPFEILRSSSQPSFVNLENGHRILLHYNIVHTNNVEETLFLAVGPGKGFGLSNPYVIYHEYYPTGLQFTSGFFISKENLEAQDYLPNSKPKALLSQFQSLQNFRVHVSRLLDSILNQKGLSSIESLLQKIKDEREIPCLDMKCCSPIRCWYCKDLCEVCLAAASVGLTVKFSSESIPLRFCSAAHKGLFTDLKQSFQVTVRDLRGVDAFVPPPPALRSVSLSHQELMFIRGHCQTSKGPLTINMTVCVGDGSEDYPTDRFYVVYNHRTIFHQQFLEFFISDALCPDQLLPSLSTSTAALLAFMGMSQMVKEIQTVLSKALKILHCSSLSELLNN